MASNESVSVVGVNPPSDIASGRIAEAFLNKKSSCKEALVCVEHIKVSFSVSFYKGAYVIIGRNRKKKR